MTLLQDTELLAADVIARNAKRYRDRTAVVCEDVRLTWKDLDERTSQVANAFVDRGLRRGDKVAQLMVNSIDPFVTFWAIVRAGLCAVPLNSMLDDESLVRLLNDSDARVVVVDDDKLPQLQGVREHLVNIDDDGWLAFGTVPDGWGSAGGRVRRHVRDHLVALLMGGHDSSAATLAWAFERLARHPHVQDRMREGDPDDLDAVVKEVLRVRPALTIAPRLLTEPVTIAGHRLPAGVQVAACLWLSMRREDLWSQASAFRPERWLEDPGAEARSWIPYGGGVRRCAGAPFAELELREVLRAASGLRLRPVRPESERARRSLLVVVPDRGGEVLVDRH